MLGRGDHHVGIEVGEQRGDGAADGDRGRGEGPTLVPGPDAEGRGERCRRPGRLRRAIRHTPASEIATVQTAKTATSDDRRPGEPAGESRGHARARAPSVLQRRGTSRRAAGTARTQREAHPEAVRREQVPERPGELLASCRSGSPASRSPRATPSSSGTSDRPDGERPAPGAAPAVGVDLGPPLERHAADDQRDEDAASARGSRPRTRWRTSSGTRRRSRRRRRSARPRCRPRPARWR